MGGLGASSATSGRSVAQELRHIADTPGASPRSVEYSRLAGIAADMASTGRYGELRGGFGVMLDAMQHYVSIPSASAMTNAKAGTNRPAGTGDGAWRNVGNLVRTMNAAGFSDDEIAAALQFRNWLERS